LIVIYQKVACLLLYCIDATPPFHPSLLTHTLPLFLPITTLTPDSEIGSGTGLVGLSLASSSQFQSREVVVTDQKDHLGLIQRNVDANSNKLHAPLFVRELDWLSDGEEEGGNGRASITSSPFDVIVGTDVAYCKELYAPVVHALEKVAGPESLILLGVTRTDTGPLFFQLLHQAGFDYCLLPTAVGDGGEGSCVEAGGFALFSVVRRGRGGGEKGGREKEMN